MDRFLTGVRLGCFGRQSCGGGVIGELCFQLGDAVVEEPVVVASALEAVFQLLVVVDGVEA